MDTFYATKDIRDALDIFEIKMVSTLHPTRNMITGIFWERIPLPVTLPAGLFCWLWYRLNEDRLKKMDGKLGVFYLRKEVQTNSFGKVVLIAQNNNGDIRFLFGSDPDMKAKTIYYSAHRRWKLERIFWSLKQEVGVDFHHQKPSRGLTRWYLAIIVHQALLITAKRYGVSTGKIFREIRRNASLLLKEIGTGSTFQKEGMFNLAQRESLAA